MKLLDILKNVGGAVVRNTVPGGGLLVDVVNELLPDNKKLPAQATGADINDAINSLPPKDRTSLLMREFNVDITQIKQANETLRAMLDADVKTPHTTRPFIAKGSFWVVSIISSLVILAWGYGVLTGNSELVKAVMDGWPFVMAVIGPFITLLWAYFGALKQEQKNRLDAAGGNPVSAGLSGLIKGFLKR